MNIDGHDDDYKTESIGAFLDFFTDKGRYIFKLNSESACGFLHHQTGFVTYVPVKEV